MRKQNESSGVDVKICRVCKLTLSLDNFCLDRHSKDGKQARCRACRSDHYKKNPHSASRQAKAWNAKNAEYVRERNLRYYYDHKSEASARMAQWYSENKKTVAENVVAWRASKPGIEARYMAKRRSDQLKATPSWANHDKIAAFYELAPLMSEETSLQHHVDHIIPLRGKTVCGLHCEANLRVIPAFDNLSKSNRHWPDMP